MSEYLKILYKRRKIVLWTTVIVLTTTLLYTLLTPTRYQAETILEMGHVGKQPIEKIEVLKQRLDPRIKIEIIPKTNVFILKSDSQELLQKAIQEILKEHQVLLDKRIESIQKRLEVLQGYFNLLENKTEGLEKIILYQQLEKISNEIIASKTALATAQPTKVTKEPSSFKISSNFKLNISLGFLLGIFIGILLSFVWEFWEKNKNRILQ
jgi:uncharacterized protein involved in exopolysaccharide biosynthesis